MRTTNDFLTSLILEWFHDDATITREKVVEELRTEFHPVNICIAFDDAVRLYNQGE